MTLVSSMIEGLKYDGEKQLKLGSHRICSAGETLKRIESQAGKFGITRVANITGLDRIGIPVTLAIRPNSRSVAVSQGKGRTLDDAKASALMEAIEIWHAENFSAPVYYGKQRDLQKNQRIIDTDQLPKAAAAGFSVDTPALWVKAVELYSGEELLVPYEMVHADYTRPVQPAHGFFPASTNGLSSGNHMLEAVCHGIAEVVERDALSIWHQRNPEFQRTQRINPASVQDINCVEILQKIGQSDIECGIWNITCDTQIACILCILREPSGNIGHLGLGSGCHPDSATALRRALTEAAQTRLNYISGARDDLGLDEYEEAGLQRKRDFADVMFGDNSCPIQFDTIPGQTFTTLRGDLEYMSKNLQSIGVEEIAVVDLAREELGIAVTRVIIPGLEAPHDDDSYVPGLRAIEAGKR